MSEAGFAVGSPMFYYPTLTDALNYTNQLGYSNSYTVGDGVIGDLMGYTSWRIASNSTGSSSQALAYANGTPLSPGGTYFMYPSAPCFLEGSRILCVVDGKETYVPIEKLQKGDLVKTSRDGLKKVEIIGSGMIQNSGGAERTETRLYRCPKEAYPELDEDLIITGCHSILVSSLTEEQREKTVKQLGQIYVTDKKYRLMACIDERAVPWQKEGSFPIWHFALENPDDGMNYGVYANGGLLVETCSIRFMKQKSNMKLIS